MKKELRLKSSDDIKRIGESGKIIAEIFKVINNISLLDLFSLELNDFIENIMNWSNLEFTDEQEAALTHLREAQTEDGVLDSRDMNALVLIFKAIAEDDDAIDNINKMAGLKEYNKKFTDKNNKFFNTASFGMSQYNHIERSIESIVKRADKALYEVKESGRNNVKALYRFHRV